MGRINVEHLEGGGASQAATALRAAYLHGLETFFYLLGAAVQAPGCLPGWVHRARPHEVRTFVRRVHSHQVAKCRLLPSAVTWSSLAKLVHGNIAKAEDRKREIQRRFGVLWERFAKDFLDELFLAEHNSFKHGFRSRAGGFVLQVGIEPAHGVAPPQSQMQTMGGSAFGSSFFVLQPIVGSPVPTKIDRHFYLAKQNLNWRPEAMFEALQLLSMSVNNLLSFLKTTHGRPGTEQTFLNPEDLAFFDRPWQRSTGTTSLRMDLPVEEPQIRRFTNDQLQGEIERLG